MGLERHEQLEPKPKTPAEKREDVQNALAAKRKNMQDGPTADLATPVQTPEKASSHIKSNAQSLHSICKEQYEELPTLVAKEIQFILMNSADATMKELANIIEEEGGSRTITTTLIKFDEATNNRYKAYETLMKYINTQ